MVCHGSTADGSPVGFAYPRPYSSAQLKGEVPSNPLDQAASPNSEFRAAAVVRPLPVGLQAVLKEYSRELARRHTAVRKGAIIDETRQMPSFLSEAFDHYVSGNSDLCYFLMHASSDSDNAQEKNTVSL